MGFRTTPQQTTRLYLPYSWIPKMRSVSLAAIRSRNSFNHIIFALLRSQLQVGKFHRLLTESFSERRELVLHISIKQLIFKTKCPIHPVFNCTTPSRRGNLAKRARIVHTSKKVTNNHSLAHRKRRDVDVHNLPRRHSRRHINHFCFLQVVRHFTCNSASLRFCKAISSR